MRNLALLILLTGLVSPAFATRQQVTVEQVEQMLHSIRSESDAKVARKLQDLELMERASSARLAQWEAESRGGRTREALIELADASAFLDPPAAEVPDVAPPDNETRRQILSRAIDYVSRAVLKLPNFSAVRTTTHFEDTPTQKSSVYFPLANSASIIRSAGSGAIPIGATYVPLHRTGTSTITVTYRDGREVIDSAKRVAAEQSVVGLTTGGEFGPILSIVFADALRSSITWGHWELVAGGREAVFQYAVPIEKSHYMVGFPARMGIEKQFPAYRGEIAVNPADGTVLRLTVVSLPRPPLDRLETAIMVEYGPVVIGERTYICPVKGVALSRMPVSSGNPDMRPSSEPLKTWLNDVAFTQYHVFRTSARILTAGDAIRGADAPAPYATRANSTETTARDNQGSMPLAVAPAGSSEAAAPAYQTSPAPVSSSASDSLPTAPNAEQAETTRNQAVPSQSASAPAAFTASDQGAAQAVATATLRTDARAVLEDVVVTDHEDEVHGVERARFRIFEDGTEQTISFFDEHRPAASAGILPLSIPPGTWTNLPDYPEASALNVVLLDELNTSVLSQETARRELLSYLHKIPAGASLAIFTLSSRLRLVQGFTTDTAQLANALQDPKAAPRASALDAPSAEALITAMARMGGSAAEVAAKDLQFEKEIAAVNRSDRSQITLAALRQLARYLSAIPGRKDLIWYSTFFPFDLDSQTSQLLAASRVAVYPVDARDLCPPTAISAGAGCQDSFQVQAEYVSMEKKMAEETGGRVYTSDFGSAIASIVKNGSSYYTLGYAPHTRRTTPGFRKIQIRLDRAKYRLAYRQSYYDPGDSVGQSSESINPVAAAMLFGAPPSTQILIDAHLRYLGEFPSASTQGAVPGSSKRLTSQAAPHRYLVDLGVNPRSIIFNKASNGDRSVDLRCVVIAYGPDAQPVNFSTGGYRLNVPVEQYARLIASGIEDNIPLRVTLDLPSGPLTLRAVVYDPATNQTGSLEIPVPVAAD